MVLFIRGKIIPEHKNPINRFLIWIYRPLIRGVLKAKTLTIVLALVALAVSLWPARQLGTEFMPSLNEGTLMYMPTTLPGISVTKAAEILQTQNKIIKTFPEVELVYGKAGRAETATDPAPTEMFETIVNLKPKEQWRAGLTVDGLIAEMDKALQFPGVSNAWTMPIKARIDMLSTGIRTPVGVKVFGTDLTEMDQLARQIETVVKDVPGTSSAYAERVIGGYYLDVVPDREALARYGLMVSDVQDRSRPRSAARRSRPRSRAASATASTCAIRAICAAIRNRSRATCWWRCRAAGRCRWARSRRSSSRAARPPSEPRTVNSPSTSSSISATAISAATSPTPRRPWPQACSFRPDIMSSGAASSNIWSAPPRD